MKTEDWRSGMPTLEDCDRIEEEGRELFRRLDALHVFDRLAWMARTARHGWGRKVRPWKKAVRRLLRIQSRHLRREGLIDLCGRRTWW